jgi:hypothetical protein
MKLVISETQYNRIFSKQKTKLVVTETQYERLLLENALNNTINQTKSGDIIKLTDKSGNILTFEVIDAFSGQVLMVNKDAGVYKNNFFFITSSDLSDGNLNFRYIHKKNVSDQSSIGSIKKNIKDWKSSTFKNIKSFEVEGNNGVININPDTGNLKEPEDNEQSEEGDITEESLTDELKDNLLRMEYDTWYKFNFKDGSSIPLKSMGEEGGKVRVAEDGNLKLLGTKDENGNLPTPKNMAEKNFQRVVSNDAFTKANDILIDVDKSKIIKINKPKAEGETYSVNEFGIILDVTGLKSDGKQISTSFSIRGLKSFEPTKENQSFKGGKEVEPMKIPSFSDEEMDAKVKEYMAGAQNLKDAIYKRPNRWLELIGAAKKRGIVPAEGLLARLGTYISREAVKSKLDRDFIPGKELKSEFIDLKLSNNDISDKVKIKEGDKFSSKVKPKRGVDKYTTLGTNLESDLKLEEKFNYRIYILRELEKRDDFGVYDVEVLDKTNSNKPGIEVAKGRLKVYMDNKKRKNV